MEITLSWDLVLWFSFIILFTYSFLLGQNLTIKLILSIYIAILTADGIAKIIKDFILDPSPGFQELIGPNEATVFLWIRMTIFLAAVITFVVKSGFHVAIKRHEHWGVRFFVHALFAILSGVLFLSTILIYLSKQSFVEGMFLTQDLAIYQHSFLAVILIDYYQFWFSLPAMAFLATSFIFPKADLND